MGIKITEQNNVLTIQLCGVHRNAMMDVCGHVSGTSTLDATIFHHIKITPDVLTKESSVAVRDVFTALWGMKHPEYAKFSKNLAVATFDNPF